MTKNKFIELLQRNLGKEVNLEEVIESTVNIESTKSSVGKFKTMVKWAVRFLRQKASKVVKELLRKLDGYFIKEVSV